MPQLLCRDTQDKEKQAERGAVGRTARSLLQLAVHSGWPQGCKGVPTGAHPCLPHGQLSSST